MINLLYLIILIPSLYFVSRGFLTLSMGIVQLLGSSIKYTSSFKKFNDLSDKISNFLYNDVALNRKYEKKAREYLQILTEMNILSDTDAAIHSYNKAYQQLYDVFKDVIPELIQEEREKKLNKILANTKN